MPGDERRMTFIVVPHGGEDLSTRSYELTYRQLWAAVIMLGIAVVVFLVMAVSWVFVAAQAARVPLLKGEVARLQRENARVEQLARTVARMEARYEQMRVMLGGDLPRPDSVAGDSTSRHSTPAPAAADSDSAEASLPRLWPLAARGFITRGQLSRAPVPHPGIDIAVASGSEILAAGAGTVEAAGEDSIYGRFIRIRHADGYESLYGHLSRLLVRLRQRVRRGQVIALSGNTGVSTAPHLHFEIRKNGSPVDPRLLLHQPE